MTVVLWCQTLSWTRNRDLLLLGLELLFADKAWGKELTTCRWLLLMNTSWTTTATVRGRIREPLGSVVRLCLAGCVLAPFCMVMCRRWRTWLLKMICYLRRTYCWWIPLCVT